MVVDGAKASETVQLKLTTKLVLLINWKEKL